MSKKKQQTPVRTITTGHVEADMLGQCYLWLSERKNSNNAHKTHRKKLKGYTFMSRSEVAKLIAYGGGSRSPSVLKRALRRICALPGKGYRMVQGYISSMRKNKRNGN